MKGYCLLVQVGAPFPVSISLTIQPLHDVVIDGLAQLQRFRLSGDFIFPPLAARAKLSGKAGSGPVVEAGLYSLLMHLPRLAHLTTGSTPLVVARLPALLHHDTLARLRLPLQQLSLGWEEALEAEELRAIARLCPDLQELKVKLKSM